MKKLWPLLLLAALFLANRYFGEPVKIPWRLTEPEAAQPAAAPAAQAAREVVGGGPVRELQAAPRHMVESHRNFGHGAPSAAKMVGAARRGLGKKP